MHHIRVPVCRDGADVDAMSAEVDEDAVPGEGPGAEVTGVVADIVQRAEPLDKARDHALAGGDDGSRLDENSSKRSCWPHGGRQLSSW